MLGHTFRTLVMSGILSYTMFLHCACLIYIYIYIFACLKMVMHFVWWTHIVRRVHPSWSWMLLTLDHGYEFKAIVIDAYSCYIVCMIVAVWFSWSMSASNIGFPVYVTRVNMSNALVSLSVRHSALNEKLCQIFSMKMGHPFTVFSQWKLGENSILCAITHLRRNVAGFPPRK